MANIQNQMDCVVVDWWLYMAPEDSRMFCNDLELMSDVVQLGYQVTGHGIASNVLIYLKS